MMEPWLTTWLLARALVVVALWLIIFVGVFLGYFSLLPGIIFFLFLLIYAIIVIIRVRPRGQ